MFLIQLFILIFSYKITIILIFYENFSFDIFLNIVLNFYFIFGIPNIRILEKFYKYYDQNYSYFNEGDLLILAELSVININFLYF